MEGLGLGRRDEGPPLLGVSTPLVSFFPCRPLALGVAVPARSLSFLDFFWDVGETPGVGVPCFGPSAVDDGEEGFVPAALGILDFSFSSEGFARDSASDSVSSYENQQKNLGVRLPKRKDFLLHHQYRNLPSLRVS